jgi:hypothetical protein
LVGVFHGFDSYGDVPTAMIRQQLFYVSFHTLGVRWPVRPLFIAFAANCGYCGGVLTTARIEERIMVIRRIGVPSKKVSRTDQEILSDTGRLLYGERWITPLANELGCSQQLVSQVFAAQRALTVEHRLKLAELCVVWLNNLPRIRESAETMARYWHDTAAIGFRPDNIERKTRSSDDDSE